MLNRGLKLWSVNTGAYRQEAERLYQSGLFEYIELYVLPGSIDTIPLWQSLDVPYVIHNAHFAHGFNLSDPKKTEENLTCYQQSREFADALNARWIIFHGGINGNIEETARQLGSFHEARALIENKPYCVSPKHLEGKRCVGATVEEIKYIQSEIGCGFCLDFGHAVCAANAMGKEPYSYVDQFMLLEPTMFHLSNVDDVQSVYDSHLALRTGELDIQSLLRRLSETAFVTFETDKQSRDDLKDFEKDMLWLNRL